MSIVYEGPSSHAFADRTRLAIASVPWDPDALSKNNQLRHTRTGQTFTPRRARQWREALALALRASATERAPWPTRKTWVSIFAVKPDHRGDAVNLVDVVCDGARDALGGVDDRWFSLFFLDWAVLRTAAGTVRVNVWQTGHGDQTLCPRCGGILEPKQRCDCPPRRRGRQE